jgi:hypothetical protein
LIADAKNLLKNLTKKAKMMTPTNEENKLIDKEIMQEVLDLLTAFLFIMSAATQKIMIGSVPEKAIGGEIKVRDNNFVFESSMGEIILNNQELRNFLQDEISKDLFDKPKNI